MLEQTAPSAGRKQGGSQESEGRHRVQLRSLSGDSGEISAIPRPVHRFQRGNKFGGRRRPADPVEEMDRIAKETISRLRRRQYEYEVDGDGKRIRVERPLDAARANALANLLRLRLDIIAQHGAGQAVRELLGELEQLRPIVAGLQAPMR